MSYVVAGILGLALLMVVHEAGHLFAARAFGMRVLRFSIGFGPPLFRYQAKGSETVYQVAVIPFLAYVQIAGMNPFEDVDPDDKGSYANGSLIGRISAIVAGPLANYVFASDRKSTRLNSSHEWIYRMPPSSCKKQKKRTKQRSAPLYMTLLWGSLLLRHC